MVNGDCCMRASGVRSIWLLALVLFWRFRSGAWRRLELIEPAPAG